MNSLVVVESPAKSVTIGRYLNDKSNKKAFKILATGGHVYQSNKVDIDNEFKLSYELIPSKRKAVDHILREMRSADSLYLATDPDREGEAISAHVLDILSARGALKGKTVHRIVFYEVTREAVLDSIEKPGDVSENLVQAQQSRDALDWLVGFNLSPLLIRKLRTPNLSAGRVQSPALRLIVERQREIERFVATEYWTIAAEISKLDDTVNPVSDKPVVAQLTHLNGKKLERFEIGDKDSASAAIDSIEAALQTANRRLKVVEIKKKRRTRKPPPPFKTSTFVQSASQRLRKSATEVTRIAQKLYEGLEINGVLTGLITYTRTDSLTLSSSAISQIRNLIGEKFGNENLPTEARLYKTKSKVAQEAHEGIRPTNIYLLPENVRSSLSQEQFLVYELIWRRTVASQMKDALFEDVSVNFEVDNHRLRTSGTTLVSAGWLTVSGPKAAGNTQSDDERSLPQFVEGEQVTVVAIKPEQHFTQPPPRYNTGSLVKQLEEYGIGRPSTWPTIITKLVDRNYVRFQEQNFYAQSLGCMVVDYLNQHFPLYVDYAFTGKIEDKLDEIAQGDRNRLNLLNEFWGEFSSHLQLKLSAPGFEVVLGTDPETGRDLLVRVRNGGSFLQLGRRTDQDRPLFRPLPKDQDPSIVTLERAIELFRLPSLPRKLTEQTRDGQVVEIKSGRYGNYFSCTDENGKVEHYNLGEDYDPHLVTIEEIEKILALPKLPRSLGSTEEFKDIVANRGRFGPYLSVTRMSGEKFNASIGKQNDPTTITLEQALEIIKTAKQKPGARTRSVIKSFESNNIQILDGRYGPYVTDGKVNASVPANLNATDLDLETCQQLISEKKQKKGTRKRSARKTTKRSA